MDELPIVLYGAIILFVVIFAAIIAVRTRQEISKQYVAEETYVGLEDAPQEEASSESENQEEWLDADGNPIIGTE